MSTQTHPEHQRIAYTVKSWFHLPFRDMGYLAEKRRWGTYWNNAQVYTSGFPSAELELFVTDLRQYYVGQSAPIYLYVDNRQADAELGPALRNAGWQVEDAERYLAHVGPVAPAVDIPGLEISPVYESNLGQFAATRLRAMGDNEDDPDPSRIKEEIAQRARELFATGRGMLARLHGQPVGIIWWHEELLDIWINQLGTRIPFRRQGVARELLRQCIEDAYYRAYKSVVLNVATRNIPALRLYESLGFQDEVYWYRRYVLENRGVHPRPSVPSLPNFQPGTILT